MSDHTTNEPTVKLCECGCGQPAPIAKKTDKRDGAIKGQPQRFISGHYGISRSEHVPPNPTGLCFCGCGKPTEKARITSRRNGYRKGDSLRYLFGHGTQEREAKRPPQKRFWSNVDKSGPGECWVYKSNLDDRGYGRIKVNSKTVRVHRFSYELHYGPIPDGLYVCHSCDNPSCVNPNHLWLGTQLDNMKDCVDKDRKGHQLGESNPSAKLAEGDIVEIRNLRASGTSVADVARTFGVSQSLISAIAKRKIWKHIP